VEYLGTLPKHAVIAGDPSGLKCLPATARRAVVTSTQLAPAYEKAYFLANRERMFGLLDAVYGRDPRAITALRSRYGATHLWIRRSAVEAEVTEPDGIRWRPRQLPYGRYVRRLAAMGRPASLTLPASCETFRRGPNAVYDIACLARVATRVVSGAVMVRARRPGCPARPAAGTRTPRRCREEGWARRSSPVYIQSFEVGNLKELDGRIAVPLVQLTGASGKPFDDPRTYAQMTTPSGLKEVAGYADVLGPDKNQIFPRAGTALADPTSPPRWSATRMRPDCGWCPTRSARRTRSCRTSSAREIRAIPRTRAPTATRPASWRCSCGRASTASSPTTPTRPSRRVSGSSDGGNRLVTWTPPPAA
jgi:hypothetical protein